MRRLVAAGMGGGEGVFGDSLGLSSHGTENGVDGGIAENHAQGERGSDGDKKRENDNQRVHVRPTFPLKREPATPDVPPRTPPSRSRVRGKASHDRLSEILLIVFHRETVELLFLFRVPDGPRYRSSAKRTEVDRVKIGPVLGRAHGVVGIDFVENATVHGAQRLIEDRVSVHRVAQRFATMFGHKYVDGRWPMAKYRLCIARNFRATGHCSSR
jgi:hypothetical protein